MKFKTLMLAAALALSAPAAALAQAATPAAAVTRSGQLVFPSAVWGRGATVAEQVDDMVRRAHERLAAQGGGIGDMLQHTIYLKDGAAPPIEVLGRFHAAARALAPSLVAKPSVGTIVRVPSFPDPDTLVMVDLTASAPGQVDKVRRAPFTFGPKEIVETVGLDQLVFTAGLEAMDFQNGKLVPGIDEQIDVIAAKLDTAMKKAGLSVGHMISHNLYVTKGTDPIHVIQRFHAATQKYAPGLRKHPSVGTLVVVDGMAVPGFLLEVDAVASTSKPETLKRVPFTEMPMDIVKTVQADGLLFVAGMEGVDFDKGNSVSPDALEQARVAARKLAGALKAAGSGAGQVVKYKLYVKAGADPQAVRDAFRRELDRLAGKAPDASESLIVVEGLAGPGLQVEVTAIAKAGAGGR